MPGRPPRTPSRESGVVRMPRVPPPTPPHTPALPRVKDSDGLYAVYVPSGIGSPSGEVFKSLKDASMFATSPLPKRYGARFKRFTSKQDAEAYALRGGDSASIKPETLSDRDTVEKVCSEPVVPFPSVTKPQLGEVKRAIEKFHNDIFVNLAEQNPRVLINTSADTPTIIAEGCRYNALHIASKCGNCAVVKYVIELVKDHESLAKIYGTKDVAFRSEVLLENFLTTPDKGENNTPLHFASKFGFVDIVALLTQYSACNLSALNKYEMSPLQVACSRYSGEGDAKKKRVSEISKYIGAYYIPLYRSADFPILTAPTYRYPRPTLNPNEIDVSKCSGDGSSKPITASPARITPLVSRMNTSLVGRLNTLTLSAVAGPFETSADAHEFFLKWNTSGKDVKKTDSEHGYEKIGRELAATEAILFMEYSSTFDKIVVTYDPSDDEFVDAEDGDSEIFFDAEEEVSEMTNLVTCFQKLVLQTP